MFVWCGLLWGDQHRQGREVGWKVYGGTPKEEDRDAASDDRACGRKARCLGSGSIVLV